MLQKTTLAHKNCLVGMPRPTSFEVPQVTLMVRFKNSSRRPRHSWSIVSRRAGRFLLFVSAAVLGATTAFAQATPPRMPGFAPTAAPDQSQAIALPGATSSAQPEQWETFYDDKTVRNVTAPTLMPVLPDPSKATGAAVIVAPGGGFLYLSMEQEGYKVARWLADHGIAAFVLKYRTRATSRDPKVFQNELNDLLRRVSTQHHDVPEVTHEALEDAYEAVKLIRRRANVWHVDPARVGFVGFSAGAITALAAGLTEDTAARPDFIAPIYGDMNARAVPAFTPPTFVALALDDAVMAKNSNLDLIQSFRAAGRPIEVHLYEHGAHGFGMRGARPASALWIDEFYAWMADCGFLKAQAR